MDLHAITVPQDPVELRKKIIEVAKIYLAAGIDPKKSTMFVQSHISEHTQLAWILSTLTKITELERMTQFKDKSQKDGKEGIGAGLLTYPTLMAADILLYDTAVVPVGEDQVQHIELTRVLARRFNEKFGETFVIPESIVGKKSARIMGLDDPTKKMSKSAASEYNYIALTDDAETVRKKIKKAVTDSGSEIVYSDSKPALKNLLNIFALLYDKKLEAIAEEYAGKNYSDFKNGLAEVIINFLSPFQERLKNISDEEVLAVLRAGAEKVKPLAREKMHQVFDKIGLISY